MSTRLAQLIAECSKPDGSLDRARLFDSLGTTPNDPTALVIEAALYTELAMARARAQDAGHASMLSGIFAEHAKQFANVLSEHSGRMEAANEQIAALHEEFAVARRDAHSRLSHDAQALIAASKALNDHADALRVSVDRHAKRSPLIAVAGLELHGPEHSAVRAIVLLLSGFFVGISSLALVALYFFRT